MAHKPIIGLEIHVELSTKTKLFCACLNDPDETHANINVCPICLGHPGTLPAPKKEAVRMVQLVGAAFHCKLADFSRFDRKNYFYPDLPKGYQISQYDHPLCVEGFFNLPSGKRIGIRRIHLEEDTGKLIHAENENYSLIDFNRAGVPLMELVTEPDLNSAEDVESFAREFQKILRYLKVSGANMEKGEMRIEVNISIHWSEKSEGTKVEIKNLNSIRAAKTAVAFEIKRQSDLLEKGDKVKQETRGFNETSQKTFSQRSKEEAHDYRYFPEPDIPPMIFSKEELETIKASIPELPSQKTERFQKEYGMSGQDVYGNELSMMINEPEYADYFEEVISELKSLSDLPIERLIKLALNYLLSDLRGILLEHSSKLQDISITPEHFAHLIQFVAENKISSRAAKDVLSEMYASGLDPELIIKDRGLLQVSDEDFIEQTARKILAENEKAVADYLAGKENALQFLLGKVMNETKGKANPATVKSILKRLAREEK